MRAGSAWSTISFSATSTGSTTGRGGVTVADHKDKCIKPNLLYWCSLELESGYVICRQCAGDWYSCPCKRIVIDEDTGFIWEENQKDRSEFILTAGQFWLALAVLCSTVIVVTGWLIYFTSKI